MSLLRDSAVDIRRYLPDYLIKDKEMNAGLQADSQEHERMRNALNDLFDQFFIETATWGLNDWERILALQPSVNDDFTQRRNKILLKLRSHQTSTLAFITELVKRYCTSSTSVKIIEENSKNMFHIMCNDGTVLYAADLIDALETYKPAHLAYNIIMHYVLDIQESTALRAGIMSCSFGRKQITISHPPSSRMKITAGIGYLRAGKMIIGAGREPLPATTSAFVGVLFIRTGRVMIPTNTTGFGTAGVNY